MKVGVKGQSAVLYVERKGVDVEVAGADYSEWFGVVHPPGVVQVDVRDLWSCIFIHTAKHQESKGFKFNILTPTNNGWKKGK